MATSDHAEHDRTADDDPTELAPANVVPADGLSESLGDEAQAGEAPSEGDGDVAPTGEDVLDR